MASVAVTGRGCPRFHQLTSQISAVVVVMMTEETMAIGEQIPDYEDVDDHHDEDGPRKPGLAHQLVKLMGTKKADSPMAIQQAQLTRKISPNPSTSENRL